MIRASKGTREWTLQNDHVTVSCDDELLPCPEDRNGRHWVRVELSTILIKYAFKISIQFWSRRDNSVVPLA